MDHSRPDSPPAANITTHAVILAAGFGSRLQAEEGHKLLVKIGGRTMLSWHLQNFARLGVRRVTVVTGYQNEVLSRAISAFSADSIAGDIDIVCAYNPDYQTSNGISVLAGVDAAGGAGVPFWLTMSDHLFDPALFLRLRETFRPAENVHGMLAVDRKLETIFDMPDATKLSLREDGSLRDISKGLTDFNRVDAGLFWCGKGFVDALRAERNTRGDCSTSDAVRRLDGRGAFYYWDVGPHLWQDVDTPEARAHAERLVADFG